MDKGFEGCRNFCKYISLYNRTPPLLFWGGYSIEKRKKMVYNQPQRKRMISFYWHRDTPRGICQAGICPVRQPSREQRKKAVFCHGFVPGLCGGNIEKLLYFCLTFGTPPPGENLIKLELKNLTKPYMKITE